MKIGQLFSSLERCGDMRMSPLARAHINTHTHRVTQRKHDAPIKTRRRKERPKTRTSFTSGELSISCAVSHVLDPNKSTFSGFYKWR